MKPDLDAPAPGSSTTRAPAAVDYASGPIRDLFLDALDGPDPARAVGIARHLVSCGNPLPSATCLALGLPAGSSYGAGARAVLAKAAAGA
jgi:hypothetical protein